MEEEFDPHQLLPPRERAEAVRLLRLVRGAERMAEEAYELGAWEEAERWDEATVQRIEDFEGYLAALEESEPIEGALPDVRSPDLLMADLYREFLEGMPSRTSGSETPYEVLVHILRVEFGYALLPGVTDEQLFDAAKDAYEARQELLARYRAKTGEAC